MKRTARHLQVVVPKITVPVRAYLREDLESAIEDVRNAVRAAIGDLSMLVHDARNNVVVDADDLAPIRDSLGAALSELKCASWYVEEVPAKVESAE